MTSCWPQRYKTYQNFRDWKQPPQLIAHDRASFYAGKGMTVETRRLHSEPLPGEILQRLRAWPRDNSDALPVQYCLDIYCDWNILPPQGVSGPPVPLLLCADQSHLDSHDGPSDCRWTGIYELNFDVLGPSVCYPPMARSVE